MARQGLGPMVGAMAACAVAMGVVPILSPARALDEQAHEAEGISACENRLCAILVNKDPKGEDLRCELTKTWAKSTIKDGDSKQLSWGFGDARCTVKLDVSRVALVNAITEPNAKFSLPPQRVDCVVEQDGVPKPVKVVVAPKIVFKAGKAEKIWIRLISVDGPTSIKWTVQTAVQLEDGLGLFHHQMLKSVNRFIYKNCPKQQAMARGEATKDKPAKKPVAKKQL